MLEQPSPKLKSALFDRREDREGFQQPKSLSAIAIRRHIGTLMLTLAVVVVGVFFIFRLQVDLLPSITYPRIGLRVDAPGVSPEVAVEEVTKPLEEALSATEGVVQVFSETREGRVRIDLFFEPGGDIDQALNDATATLNRSRDRLPDIVEEPRLFKFDPSQLPIYEFALESPSLQDVELRVFADDELNRELSIVAGVASVDVSGGVTEEVGINIDLKRLQALGVGLDDVLDALEERNQDFTGGRLRGEAGEPLTRTVGRFRDAQEIRNLSLEVSGSNNQDSGLGRRRIYLRDVAQVIDGTAEQRVFVSLNGSPAVKVSIQKQPDANTIAVVDGVKKRLAFLRQSGVIPEDMKLVTTLDESRFILNSIANVTSAGLIGTLLAAIAVLLFLGSLRKTLIIIIAIPLATLTSIILMKLFGLSINVFSLGGLALGVGIVVDNSIVMLENIASRVSSQWSVVGRTPPDTAKLIQTAEQSSQEVESALIASTTTNLVAVLPFLLIGGFFSLLFNEIILTITFAVAASLLLALTLVPMLASRLLGIRWSSGIGNFWLFRAFNHRFEAAKVNYTRLLTGVLRYRLLVIAFAFLLLGGGSLWMVNRIPQEILPPINTGQARLFAQFPPGTTLATNRKVMKAVDQIIMQQPEMEYAFTTTGGFIFGSTTIENLLRSSSTITLKPGSDVEAFVERVSQEFDKLNLVNIRLRMFPGRVRGLILSNSPIWGADIDLILQGKDSQRLEVAGSQLLEVLDERVTLARFRPDADPKQPEIQIRPDWERLGALGLTTQDLGETIETAILGTVPTQLQRGERLVDVRVQLDEQSRQRISQLEQIPLFVDNNNPIRLGDVATLEKGKAPGEIQRINQRQVFIIGGNLTEGASLSEAVAEVEAVLADVDLPDGVSLLPSSVAKSNKQLQGSLKLLGGLAVFLVFVVMAVQYNSLIDPLVIILTVPLALAGGIFGLFITQTAIGATVLVGAVLLVGIVVNNAIVMVELANQLRKEYGISRKMAILKAAPQRLRPILMTTITTVLGLFPLALGIGEGSEFLQPLGVVVFSGLSLATLLTLFIIPCFYVLLHDLFSARSLSEK
ncbi:MAG: efflux RND transporter permease subunit [Xenococcaceae cyanobacterium]